MREVNIFNRYERIKVAIEDRLSNMQVPTDVQFLYLLADLICEKSFTKFAKKYGLIRLDPDFIDVAKTEWLAMEGITAFELDCCKLWNQFCDDFENDKRTQNIAPTLNY